MHKWDAPVFRNQKFAWILMKLNRTLKGKKNLTSRSSVISLVWQIAFWLLVSSGGNAQIIPDRSLGNEQSQVRSEVNRDRIEGGAIRGGNLFHSFEEFNVGNTRAVYFSNPEGVTRIFGRVTGANPSQILGTLGVLGNADLFLLNPNGFIFGSQAKLDLRGSFFAMTGDRLQFETDTFNARDPNVPTLLTVSVPTGLQMGANPGAIVYQGSGSQTTRSELRVQPGETLGLIGGNLNLVESNLLAPSGRIELGSLAGDQQIQFISTASGYRLEYAARQILQDIQLNRVQIGLDSLESVGSREAELPSGSLQLQGRQVAIANSVIQAQSGLAAVGQSGDLTFRTTGELQLQQSQIRTRTSGSASGSNVAINTNILTLQNSAIDTITSSSGTGGNIAIQSANLILEDGSLLRARTAGSGRSGTVSLIVNQLEARGGSQILTASSGQGAADTVRVTAGDRVLISGSNPNYRPASAESATPNSAISTLASQSSSSGSAGAVVVNAPLFIVENGALVEVRSTGSGNTGNLEIRANEIQLLDGRLGSQTNSGKAGELILSARDGFLSRNRPVITATTNSGTGGTIFLVGDNILLEGGLQILSRASREGAAGDIIVRTNRFTVRDNVQMTVGSQGQGSSGRMDVDAGRIEIEESLLSAETESGTQGNILLRSRTAIQLRDRATISASTVDGRGGRIQLTAPNTIELASGSQILSQATGNGQAGEIRVDGDRVNLRNAEIKVDTQGRGAAGSLRIEANQIRLNRSLLTAETNSGRGGELRLLSGGNILLNNASTISASTQTGLAGQIVLTALEGVQLTNRSQILSGTQRNGAAGGIQVLTERLSIRSGSQMEVNGQERGQAGSIRIDARLVTLDRGRLNAETRAGDRGNIRLFASDAVILTNRSAVNTNAQAQATGGNIDVNSPFLLTLQNSDVTAQAERGQGGRIDLTVNNRFSDPRSNITAAATSAFGEDGIVTVTAPNVDARSAIIELAVQTPIDPSDRITIGCPADQGANFSIAGRGGVPADPRQVLQGSVTMQDWREGLGSSESVETINLIGLPTVSTVSTLPTVSTLSTLSAAPHVSTASHVSTAPHVSTASNTSTVLNSPIHSMAEAQGFQLNELGQPELVTYGQGNALNFGEQCRASEVPPLPIHL
jgi:filamentous hemagglutinin family protein